MTYIMENTVTVGSGKVETVGKVSDICGANTFFLSGKLSLGAGSNDSKCIVVSTNWNWNQYISILNMSSVSVDIKYPITIAYINI